ncbi:MAG: PD40 domain-containing protein [Candidatus Eisenbacteria bacterium]|nr:PD40 domain-containing protein [Candidatus Eisenbacteria bacterium]
MRSRTRLLGLLCALPLASAGCKDEAPEDLIRSETTTEALVFVKTRATETLNRNWEEGNLYKLSPISPEGRVTPLTDFVGASISDPCVSFDGKRILFSMRPEGGQTRNIWEIGADGSGLRQVTRGGGHDFDPLYLPDGRILFTSSRAGEMDEYNHAPAEHLYTCGADGGEVERISFNQSDDFDPVLLPTGRILYTRWEHFGTMNRFPLFETNPDGTGTFHSFGPHERNFFHPQPTPDGRIIAIESTEVNGDHGPVAMLRPERGPADPAASGHDAHWNVLTAQIDPGGAPWDHGVFKYPHPLGRGKYVVSYSLPAASEEEVDYGLYTFTADILEGEAGAADRFEIRSLTFLYDDPEMNEYDAQLIAPRTKPPVIPSSVNRAVDHGEFLAQDVFNRGTEDGQERPLRGEDPIERIAVMIARPTGVGEMNDISANEFEKRAFLGYAPVESDGSFRIRVPADTPLAFATLDEQGRGFVVKRTWIYVRPGEEFNRCTGCHEDRVEGGLHPTNPNPLAALRSATDLNVRPENATVINFRDDIGPIVEAKCASCHHETYVDRDSTLADGTVVAVTDTIPPPADLDLTAVPDTLDRMGRVFPRAYVSLSGESERMEEQVVVPAFPRRSRLIDAVLGLGAADAPHPGGESSLNDAEKELFNLWVLLGAQYR